MKRYYIGIDIGGTYIKIILYEEFSQRIITRIKTHFINKTNALEEIKYNIINCIDDILIKFKTNKASLNGIGVSIAANFDRDSGDVIKWSNNKKWSKVPIKKLLEEKYKTNIILEDDANCAGYAEHIFGAAKDNLNSIYITISTGIGAALILDNKLFIGDRGFAGELGHIKIKGVKEKCSCGNLGCLQAVCSGTGIRNKLNDRIKSFDNDITLEEWMISKYYNKQETEKIFTQARGYLSEVLDMLERIFGISCFVLGGGIAKLQDYFFKPLELEMKKLNPNIELKQAILGDFNGAVGALTLIYNDTTKKEIKINNLFEE